MSPTNSAHVTPVSVPRARPGSRCLAARGWWAAGALLAAAAASGAPPVPAGPEGQFTSPVAAPAGPLTADWIEDWLAIIRRLYQLLGGDPHDLDQYDVPQAMAAVTNYYNAHGCPSGLTAAQQAAGRADVEAAYDMTNPPAPASSVTTQFRAMLRSLYADLGGDPNTL